MFLSVCLSRGEEGRKRKQVVSVVEQQNSISPPGLSLHRCFIQAPWQGHSKKCSSPTQFSSFVCWSRESQPTVHCSSSTSLTHLLMLVGETIGVGHAQKRGGVAIQQNGLWILCLWILWVGGPNLFPFRVSLYTYTQKHALSACAVWGLWRCPEWTPDIGLWN